MRYRAERDTDISFLSVRHVVVLPLNEFIISSKFFWLYGTASF